MCQNTYFGRNSNLVAQFETAYGTPPVTPATQLLRFSEIEAGEEVELEDDATVTSDVLPPKRDDMDATVMATGKHILCLNGIGFWLKGLLGAPVTTGAGPYTHTFTLSLDPRPSMLMELAMGIGTANASFHRYLGMLVNEMGWAVMERDQSFTTSLIGASQVSPDPVAAFDGTPAAHYAKSRACTKKGHIYDVTPNSTLGDITKGNVMFANDLEGQKLADGQAGFSCALLGEPRLTVNLTALYAKDSVVDAAFARTSKKVVLKSANAAGTHSLTLTMPNVEFDVPKRSIKTKKALVVDLAGRAHQVAGADPVTIVLVNAVPSY